MFDSKQEQTIQEYVHTLISYEYDFHREHNPEKFAKWLADPKIEEYKVEFEGKVYSQAIELAAAILEKSPVFVKKFLNGLFDLQNPASRKLFSGVTGITLPKTQKETHQIIHEYVGEEIEKFLEEKRVVEEEELAQLNAKTAQKEKEYKDRLSSLVLSDTSISGQELVDLCYFLNITVHPRTVGLLQRNVVNVNSYTSDQYGKRKTNSIYHLYQECKGKLEQGIESCTTQIT